MMKIKVHPEVIAEKAKTLSGREIQIMVGVLYGLGTIELAKRLHISPKTISTMKNRLFEKTDTSSHAELMAHAIYQGYATIEDDVLSPQAQLRIKAEELRKRGFIRKDTPLDLLAAIS